MEQVQQGLPRYAIVGIATSKCDPTTPEYNIRLITSALLKAIKNFNSEGRDPVSRVGLQPDDLELKKIAPETAFRIIREVYDAR